MISMIESIVRRLSLPFLEKKLLQWHLRGKFFMAPRMSFQKMWARHLSPEIYFSEELNSWQLLQRFSLPLTRQFASAFHLHGIRELGLDQDSPPDFASFRQQVQQISGWDLLPYDDELPAPEFFALLARKKFPCVQRMRLNTEVFAASQPDFWHESIGHIALLASPESAQFYHWCGLLLTELFSDGNSKNQIFAQEIAGVLWVLLEYGFIQEGNQFKSFGAALTGSYMALQRFKGDFLAIQGSWDCEDILQSKLHVDGAPLPRDKQGKIIFFAMKDLTDARTRILDFVASRRV